MRIPLAIYIILLLLITSSKAQDLRIDRVNENRNISYKIDAHKFLKKHDAEVIKYLNDNPNYFNELKLQKKAAWNFSVGSTKSWYAYNIETDNFYTVPSTCKAVGTNCYIFVENSIWNTEVNQENVNAIKNAFDNSTPANNNKGVYQTVVESFGNPPNVDGDSKIIILILDIKDGYTGSGGFVAGYFHSVNEISHPKSNNAEIYYLDANPSNLATESGLNNVMSTTAHEFQHMIHFNYHNGSSGKPEQITFLNEGCSLAAEVVCGYPLYNQSLYNNEYNHYLFDWRSDDDVLSDYSRAARYLTYLYEQFGIDFLRKLVQSSLTGVASINDALAKLSNPTSLRFSETLENWFIANNINSKEYNSKWGYDIEEAHQVSATDLANPNNESQTITVKQSAADYLNFSIGRNLSIYFNDFGNAKLKFMAFKFNDKSLIEVQNLTANTQYNFTNFGINYNNISFAIMNTSSSNTYSYSYVSTGEANFVELTYDENPPVGVLPLSANDTVCVFFDGVQNGKLDSIKVALRQAGSIYGSIYNYTGESRPTPLGKKIFSNLTATSTITQIPQYDPILNKYPDPWPNWVTIDLTSYNIDATNPFAIAFLDEGTYPNSNRIMVTEQPNIDNHSLTYLNSPSSGSADWYYLSSSETDVFAYLIRAYVSFGITNVDESKVQFIPQEFNLLQNYPNPFNPNTTIEYKIPNVKSNKSINVQLKVYDVLGNEIELLVNERKQPGNYKINFDAKNLASGIYYYSLSSESFFKTKKMILLK